MLEIDRALQMTMQQTQNTQQIQQQIAMAKRMGNVSPGKDQNEAVKNMMSQIAGSVNPLVPQGR